MEKLTISSGLLLFFFIVLNSCISIRDIGKLKVNPGFEKNAEKSFVITTPSVSGTKFGLEDKALNEVYEIEINMGDSHTDISIIDESISFWGVYRSETKEVTSHKFYILNPVDSSEYEVVGKTEYIRGRKDHFNLFKTTVKNKESRGHFVYPIDFWIFEDGKDVGKITFHKPASIRTTVKGLAWTAVYVSVIIFHNKDYNVEHQTMSPGGNIRKVVSFDDESGLIALIGLEPKSTITTKMKGEIFIKRSLSVDIKSDIFTLYLMVEATLRKKQESGI